MCQRRKLPNTFLCCLAKGDTAHRRRRTLSISSLRIWVISRELISYCTVSLGAISSASEVRSCHRQPSPSLAALLSPVLLRISPSFSRVTFVRLRRRHARRVSRRKGTCHHRGGTREALLSVPRHSQAKTTQLS